MSDGDMNRFILDKLDKVDDKLEEVRLKYTRLESSLKNHETIDEKIHQSVEKMASEMNVQMSTICDSLDQYNALLQEHMRRTELAEESITILVNKVSPVIEDFNTRGIIESYADKKWKTRMKWLGAIATATGVIISVLKLFNIF